MLYNALFSYNACSENKILIEKKRIYIVNILGEASEKAMVQYMLKRPVHMQLWKTNFEILVGSIEAWSGPPSWITALLWKYIYIYIYIPSVVNAINLFNK
jgi:uncharacterized membrane protein